MLNFIGMGSAFNTEKGNTSAFIKKGNSLLLIDCGGTVFHRLQALKLLDGIENLYIIITHTHPDHVGSLGDIIFYSYYILQCIPNLFFPEKERMEGFLNNMGVSSEMVRLHSSEIIDGNDAQMGKFRIEFLSVSHVDTIPAYGLLMKLNEESFYYSGDANNISSMVMNRLMNGDINRIYQDTCGLDYEGNCHLSLTKLCSIVPPEYRSKVYCMHLDQHITERKIKEKGFQVVEVYQ